MTRRLACSLAVLAGAIYWANCSFDPQGVPQTDHNGFFAGCFQGPITDPAGGNVTLVLDAATDDSLLLNGCARWSDTAGNLETGTLAGMVLEERRNASVTVTRPLGASFTLLVQRTPDGNVDAVTVTLSNQEGAPFDSAPNLPRCTLTCQDLGIAVPFLPSGGTQ